MKKTIFVFHWHWLWHFSLVPLRCRVSPAEAAMVWGRA